MICPTFKLRYVERFKTFYCGDSSYLTKAEKIKVLQQWWQESVGALVDMSEARGEWRDIPTEIEE